jgi:hypothetical protein
MSQGLRQQILTAKSVEAATQLLEVGKTYEFASRETRNGWKNAARRVSAWLKGEKPVAVAQVEQEEVDDAPKKKRGNKKKDRAVASA